MITLVIGHRGVGKTALLERVRAYAQAEGQPVELLDLDHEIERSSGCSVLELFKTQGEAHYRKLEELVLKKLCNQAPAWRATWISVGAGFEGELPQGPRVLWLRRPTDSSGRVFLDRPVLNAELSPLEEYRARFEIRDPRYARWATQEYLMPEGFTGLSGVEAQVLGLRDGEPAGGFATALKADREELSRLLKLGADKIELRDDLLDAGQIQFAGEFLPREKILYSFRRCASFPKALEGVWTDWALELQGAPSLEPKIFSRHERRSNFFETLRDWPQLGGAILKLAVEVRDFQELQEGHRWWQEDPKRRSFLPRSKDGRWAWYRQLFSHKMPVSFWREGSGSAQDQPTISDWLRTPKIWSRFAAVLGSPVSHSWTPAEHGAYFFEKEMPVVAIPMSLDEWTPEVLNWLGQIGLSAAAVTSPLKLKSFEMVNQSTESAKEFGAVNTLLRNKQGWKGHNTDVIGFRAMIESVTVDETRTVVWGGGGTRPIMKAVLPNAGFFSLKENRFLNHEASPPPDSPQTLVWATNRDKLKWPAPDWRPRLVLDLNYGSDSPGLEYAKSVNAKYQDGAQMFRAQAQAQRAFWDREGF